MKNFDFLSRDENILYQGRPNFLRMLISNNIFVLAIMLFILSSILHFMINLNGIFITFTIAMLVISLIPTTFIYETTKYIVTNKKIVLESGFFGKDYEMIKFEKIVNTQLDVKPIDYIMGTGNIHLYTANDTEPFILKGIKKPKAIITKINMC